MAITQQALTAAVGSTERVHRQTKRRDRLTCLQILLDELEHVPCVLLAAERSDFIWLKHSQRQMPAVAPRRARAHPARLKQNHVVHALLGQMVRRATARDACPNDDHTRC